MSKLCQIVALSSGKKSASESKMKTAYQTFQKKHLFDGLERNYRPRVEDGEILPSESTKINAKVKSTIESVKTAWTNMFDVVLTQDTGNQVAKANVVVDGEVILENVPITTLIFLEKQLVDIMTMISEIPTVSTTETWDKNEDIFISKIITTNRTKKVQKPIVLYHATDKHPAQTQLISEDETVGYWDTKKISGAITETEKNTYLNNAQAIKDAVIKAREQANSIEVVDLNEGHKVFNYIFGM